MRVPAGDELREDSRASLTAAVRAVLAQEARGNEQRVGVVRLCGYGSVLVLDVVLAIAGIRPPLEILRSVVSTSVSLGIFSVLRYGRFRTIYAYLIPVVDATLIAFMLAPRIAHFGAGNGITATAALVCGLFAMVGALRFARPASFWATGLAAVLFCVLLGPYARIHELLYGLVSLVTIGLLAMWLADVVRRSMEGAASRVLLERFLPHDLVQGAFDDPLATLAGPRTLDATVLVSDLRGFTALCEGVPPHQIFAFLSELQGALARVIALNGGAVDKFMGDGMLAVFVLEGGDHPAQAVAAARGIREAVAALNARGLLREPVRLGIGIHCGPLVAGYLGTGDRLEATIIGDTVNIASRLEALTKELAVDVVMSADVAELARATGPSLGSVPIRGRVQPIEIRALDA